MASSKLANILKDKLLECPICLEIFKDPRALPCLHVFCLECIFQHIRQGTNEEFTAHTDSCSGAGRGSQVGNTTGQFKLTCPVCKESHDLPEKNADHLRKSFIHSVLADEVELMDKGSKEKLCDSCDEMLTAQFACMVCGEFFCTGCKDIHQKLKKTKDHEITPVEDVPGDIDTLRSFHPARNFLCSTHPKEELKLYCETIAEPMCNMCVFSGSHRKHMPDMHKTLEEKVEENQEVLKKNVQLAHDVVSRKVARLEEVRQLKIKLEERRNSLHAQVAASEEEIIKELATISAAMKNSINTITDKLNKDFQQEEEKLEQEQDDIRKLVKQGELLDKLPEGKILVPTLELSQQLQKVLLLNTEATVAHPRDETSVNQEGQARGYQPIQTVARSEANQPPRAVAKSEANQPPRALHPFGQTQYQTSQFLPFQFKPQVPPKTPSPFTYQSSNVRTKNVPMTDRGNLMWTSSPTSSGQQPQFETDLAAENPEYSPAGNERAAGLSEASLPKQENGFPYIQKAGKAVNIRGTLQQQFGTVKQQH